MDTSSWAYHEQRAADMFEKDAYNFCIVPSASSNRKRACISHLEKEYRMAGALLATNLEADEMDSLSPASDQSDQGG